MKSTFSVIYYLKRQVVKKDGTVPVMGRITVDGSQTQFSCKLTVDPKLWDTKGGRVTGRSSAALETNRMLDKMRVRINKHYQEIMERDNFVTAEKVKNAFLGLEHRYHTLMQVFRQHNEDYEKQVDAGMKAKGTLLKYRTVYKHLQEFLTIRYRVKDIALKELTPAFISDFEMFLRTDKHCCTNTVWLYVCPLRTMVFIAINNEWLTRDPFREYEIKKEETTRSFLTKEEIRLLMEGRLKNAKQELYRDLYLFCAFTGLSFADMRNLTEENIHTYFDEHEWININRQKTGVVSNIRLLDIANQIYDIHAIRIKVDTVRDCYAALGIIHEKYKPIPGRFKDYIAMPKENMYQSLHTTLIGPGGRPFEIQIRTYEMHRTAEYGIAAHWKYKEGGSGKNDNEEQKLSWLRQILEWQTDTTDNKEFMNAIKTDLDLFSDQVYVFTPAGDVKNLPAGSTPIDFAYSIHTAVGNKLIGARVNGRQVPIETELHNGDRVEIITSQNSKGPSMDWLSVVKSSQAKTKINQWFRQENKTDNIQRGKDAMAAYCKTKGIVLSNLLQPELQEKVMKKYNFLTWDAVLASIGHGGLKEGQVVNRLQEEYKKEEAKKITEEQIVDKINTPGRGESHKHAKGGIVVKGMDDVAVRFSRCCAPVPGDEIVGYITRGRGVSIHRTDCVNVLCMDEFDRKRLIEAEWSEDLLQNQKMYMTEINIYANDSKGLVFSLSKIFNEENINLTGMNVRVNKQGKATVSVKFEIRSKEQLNKLIAKIRNVEGIIDIERTTG